MNFTLRLALEKAKEVNLPKENIERAIKKGTGDLAGEAQLEEITYEGFGPGGIGVLVDVVTDNKNRTASDMKHIFSLHGGSMAGPGSVKWQFARLGVVRLDAVQKEKVKTKKSDFDLTLIDAGADDIIESDFGTEIRCKVESFQKLLEAVKSQGIEPASAELEWVAKENMSVSPEVSEQMGKLYDALEENDDVRAVYTNEA